MALEIERLSAALGAEVRGLDLSRALEPTDRRAIREAFLAHHLLCFRSPPLTAPALVAVAKHFGTPQLQLIRSRYHPDAPEVSVLDGTYERAEDKPRDLSRVRLSGWHTDDSYFEVPAKATLLHAIAVPETGGETQFCNTRAAYEALGDALRRRIDGLCATHKYDTVRAGARAPALTATEASETPDVVHPLVRTHEDTGRKAIYFNPNRTDAVCGLDRAESDALLDRLHAQMTEARFRYDHAWRVGDILLWDNRCLVHSVNVDYPVGQKRLNHRILLKGTRPV